MITVLDPLFKPTGDPIASTSLATEIPKEASAIAGAMGCPTIETLTIGATLSDGSDASTNVLKKINDNLYSDKAKFIIPILLETPTIPEGGTEKQLGNAYTNCHVSYLVISPRCLTPKAVVDKVDGSDVVDEVGTFSVCKIGGVGIKGSTTADANGKTVDQLNLDALMKPGLDANLNIVPVEKTAIEAAGLRLTNYRLYRNGKDDYPITFDDIDSLFYGYKETSETINEVVITNSKFSLSLVQQVLCTTNYKMFPIFPTDYKSYFVDSAAKIKPIGGDATQFNVVAISYRDSTTDPSETIGLSASEISVPTGYSNYFCHIYEKIYLLTTN